MIDGRRFRHALFRTMLAYAFIRSSTAFALDEVHEQWGMVYPGELVTRPFIYRGDLTGSWKVEEMDFGCSCTAVTDTPDVVTFPAGLQLHVRVQYPKRLGDDTTSIYVRLRNMATDQTHEVKIIVHAEVVDQLTIGPTDVRFVDRTASVTFKKTKRPEAWDRFQAIAVVQGSPSSEEIQATWLNSERGEFTFTRAGFEHDLGTYRREILLRFFHQTTQLAHEQSLIATLTAPGPVQAIPASLLMDSVRVDDQLKDYLSITSTDERDDFSRRPPAITSSDPQRLSTSWTMTGLRSGDITVHLHGVRPIGKVTGEIRITTESGWTLHVPAAGSIAGKEIR